MKALKSLNQKILFQNYNKCQFLKRSLKNCSKENLATEKNGAITKKTDEEDFYIEKLDLNSNENESNEIIRKDSLNSLKQKNEDKYEKVNNLKAYQISNNIMIINAISKNRDIKRTISDKTDCSDDIFIGMSDSLWNNNKDDNGVDLEELDNNKIEELIQFVKSTNLKEFAKFKPQELNKLTDKEYKKHIIDTLIFLQFNIQKKFIAKVDENPINTINIEANDNKVEKMNDSEKDISEKILQKYGSENRNLDKFFLEKRNKKRIIYAQSTKLSEKEMQEALEYLNEKSKIDFDTIKDQDPDIINKFIPQSIKDRKRFKQIIDLKSESIMV